MYDFLRKLESVTDAIIRYALVVFTLIIAATEAIIYLIGTTCLWIFGHFDLSKAEYMHGRLFKWLGRRLDGIFRIGIKVLSAMNNRGQYHGTIYQLDRMRTDVNEMVEKRLKKTKLKKDRKLNCTRTKAFDRNIRGFCSFFLQTLTLTDISIRQQKSHKKHFL